MNSILPGQFIIPDVLATNFHLKIGDSVADFGAGNGFFLKALSKAVGPEGRVYAVEIQKQLVDKLGELARLQGLGNVHPIWGDLEELNGTKMRTESLDAVILVNTLFQVVDKPLVLQEAYRALRHGGVLHIVDWSDAGSTLGPRKGDIVTQEQAIALAESHRFMYERDYPAGDHHYGIAVRKI